MIKSMTGFGRSKYENDGREYEVEIKSVNHKYSDISIKTSRNISYLEDIIRKKILQNIARGKIDVYVGLSNFSDKGKNIKINKELAKLYIKELRELAEEEKIEENISVMKIAEFPEVLKLKSDENEEIIIEEVDRAVGFALDSFIDMRKKEGSKIQQDLKQRMERISKKVEEIKEYSTGLVEEYIVKLEERVKELLKTEIVDQTRLAQEIVIYSDKCSIEEELTRLKSHISQFLNLLEENIPVGKKLDFLIQEMNREINTIGSKANCLDITKLVIDSKTEIEDVREQIQNIE